MFNFGKTFFCQVSYCLLYLPDGVFENNTYVHVPDGFVAPAYRDGGLYIADMSDQSKVEIGNGKTHSLIHSLTRLPTHSPGFWASCLLSSLVSGMTV